MTDNLAENTAIETRIPRRRTLPAAEKKNILMLHGARCLFPGCDLPLIDKETSAFIGHVASIRAVHPGGPRHDSSIPDEELFRAENYMLLCPNHHQIIDIAPERFPVAWLEKARTDHFARIRAIVSDGDQPTPKLTPDVEVSLESAVQVWNSNKTTSSEEFWQQLFRNCPAILAQAFPSSVLLFGSKCYVGGKSIENTGGNLVDFLYASSKTNNVILIEIKTPITKLLGKKYRANSYSMSDELSGSIVQVLNYREQLLKEYYSLSRSDEATSFNAYSPKCVVVVGSVDMEMDSPVKLKSFELFRNAATTVQVITYDEIFGKAQDVLDLLG